MLWIPTRSRVGSARRRAGAPAHTADRKGETWFPPNRTPSVGRSGLWVRRTPRRRPGDLDAHLAFAVSELAADLAAWRDLARRFRAEAFCGLWLYRDGMGFDALAPETMALLAERGLRLELDIYLDLLPGVSSFKGRVCSGFGPSLTVCGTPAA